MNKKRNDYLIQLADNVLNQGAETILNRNRLEIQESYNGQIAALGVSIAMCDLRPTLAIYYQSNDNGTCAVDRRKILEIIGRMIHLDENHPERLNANYSGIFDTIQNANSLLRQAITIPPPQFKLLKTVVIDCAVALKQVIRTYNLV